jgi:hypothetical protein
MADDNLMMEDDTPPQLDPSKDYFAELVGEGRKFKDPQTLARSKVESDNYVKILERRIDAIREDYLKVKEENNTSKRLEDLIDQMSSKSQDRDNTQQRQEERQPTVDLKQIESLVSSKIQEDYASRQQSANFNTVKEKLKERYGENFKARLEEQLEDLGITEKDLNDMARRQPKVLIRTLGLDKQPEREQFQSPPYSSQRSDSFSPSSPKKRTWAHYQKIKAENPKAWLDPKIAVQMQKDAIEQGDAFYDGDFYKPGLH